jgi:hypothetical protein
MIKEHNLRQRACQYINLEKPGEEYCVCCQENN